MTGNKQAVIAYKVRSTDGAPLDINGKPTSETGRKQAIALLVGSANPSPSLYEVQRYFNPDAYILGSPTVEYDPAACAPGFISISPSNLVFTTGGTPQAFSLVSSAAWQVGVLPAALLGIFNFDRVAGLRGTSTVSVSLVPAAPYGQGTLEYTNIETGQTSEIYLVYAADLTLWVLDGGTWHLDGFWFNNKIFNF